MSAPAIGATRYIGQRTLRKEDLRLLTGRGTFTDDVRVPGALHVAFIRSQIARGRITVLDLSHAREVPGVHAVLSAEDLGDLNVKLSNMHLKDEGGPPTRPLSGDYVSYVGDPVAMVIADSRYIAEDAAALAWIEYEEEDPLITCADAMDGAVVHPGTENNIVRQVGTPPNPKSTKSWPERRMS